MPRSTRRLAAAATSLAVAAVSSVALATPAHAAACDTTTTLTVLNFNDFHGRLDSANPNTVLFAGTIEEQRAQAGGDDKSLVLSAGDNIGASLFASFIAQDLPTIDLLNAMDVSASAVGNHEFDTGFPRLNGEIKQRATFPYLAANVYQKGTTTPALPAYAIVQKAGLRVAIVGAVTTDTPNMVSPAGIADVEFGDPVEAVNRTIKQLKDGDAANGEADVILVEYHEGPPGSGTLADNEAASAVFKRIVEQTDARAQAIFNGHTHQTYAYAAPAPGGGTRPVVQSGSYASNIGKVALTVDATTGASCTATQTNLGMSTTPVDTLVASYPRAKAAKSVVDGALSNANQVGQQKVGSASAAITRSKATGNDRGYESAMTNMVADMFFDTLSDGDASFIGMQNPGGTRADLASGDITYAAAAAVLPFANSLMTTKVTGAQLKQVLEEQWQRDVNGVPLATGRQFLRLGLSKNVSYTYDESRPFNDRITSITVNGAPVDPAKLYTVGSGSFLIAGGDNFRTLGKGTQTKDTGKADLEAWVSWVKAKSPLAPSFAMRGVSVSSATATVGKPTRITVGAPLGTNPLALDTLDMTSTGAQPTTTVTAKIDGVDVGTGTAAQGKVTLDVTVPASVGSGTHSVTLTAAPAGTSVVAPITVVDAGAYVPTAPTRFLDTRTGLGYPSAVLPGQSITVQVAGKAGVPAGAGAVQMMLLVTNASEAGWVAAYPSGGIAPTVSSLNFVARQDKPNLVTVKLGADGAITLRNGSAGTLHLVADVAGWFGAGEPTEAGMLKTVEPRRVVDTRDAGGAVAPNSTRQVSLASDPSRPAGAVAAVVNLTATNATAAGYLSAYAGTTAPGTSALNFTAGETAANGITVPLTQDGTFTVLNASVGTTDVVVDIVGYVTGGQATKPGAYVAATPTRWLDTRTTGPVRGQDSVTLPKDPATGRTYAAALVNLTVTEPQAPGYLTAYPMGSPRPLASNVNFVRGQTVASSATVKLNGNQMSVAVGSVAPAHVVVDLLGYYLG